MSDTIDLSNLSIRSIEESTTYRARQGSYSVKTTIPQIVAEALGIKPHENNVLAWTIAFRDDGESEPVILVTRKEEE